MMTRRGFIRFVRGPGRLGFIASILFGAAFTLGLIMMSHPAVFWPQWVIQEVAIIVGGISVIHGRRLRAEAKRDADQIDFWDKELNRLARELAFKVMSGEIGLAVRPGGTEQLESLMEQMRAALLRFQSETNAVHKKWVGRGIITKDDEKEIHHGQKE